MIINQPFINALGYDIINNLQSGRYSLFRFVVAYAKTSGVNRLLPYMQQFKDVGGIIQGVVGIDQKNTSYEALTSLLGICDELFVFHSEDPMRTFHVKAYHMKGEEESWVSIGSNNLTAGGLFSNYEASISLCSDEQYDADFDTLFHNYTDTTSPCCRQLDQPFIDLLLEKCYIEREVQLARQRIVDTTRQRSRRPEDILFGRGSAINIPRIPGTAEVGRAPEQHPVSPEVPTATEMNYLIRYVPRAGDRSMQVHFTLEILHDYFGMVPGDSLYLQQISNIYTPHHIESRRIVFSERNKNVKVEVSAAVILNHNYPENPDMRPILVFKRVNSTFFEYMLLMEGLPGYAELNARLNRLDWHHRSLQYEIIDANTMLSTWNECPLL